MTDCLFCKFVSKEFETKIVFENEDNFQKQTYRNRCYMYTSYGKHVLTVPVQHNKNIKLKTKDVKIYLRLFFELLLYSKNPHMAFITTIIIFI